MDFEALTYAENDVVEYCNNSPEEAEANPVALTCDEARALLPWRLLAHGIDLRRVFLLQMSVLVAPEITVQFTEDSYTVAEGDTQAVTVELNGDPRRTFTSPSRQRTRAARPPPTIPHRPA